MGLVLTRSATTAAVVRILGRRVDELTSAIREAIAALETSGDTRPTDHQIADRMREAL